VCHVNDRFLLEDFCASAKTLQTKKLLKVSFSSSEHVDEDH
jgi:hypothetical protein